MHGVYAAKRCPQNDLSAPLPPLAALKRGAQPAHQAVWPFENCLHEGPDPKFVVLKCCSPWDLQVPTRNGPRKEMFIKNKSVEQELNLSRS